MWASDMAVKIQLQRLSGVKGKQYGHALTCGTDGGEGVSSTTCGSLAALAGSALHGRGDVLVSERTGGLAGGSQPSRCLGFRNPIPL